MGLLPRRIFQGVRTAVIMFSARSKIQKPKGVEPDVLEESVATALYELQVNSKELKPALREVHISAAKEVDIRDGRKAVVIFVPVPKLAQFQKLIKQKNLIGELEKKFSGKQVVVLAERRIIRKELPNNRQLRQKRPRSRTLTAVHEEILNDIVYPQEIVGKRTRVKLDGSKLLKVHLQDDNKAVQERLDAYSKVYKKLTGKDIVFEFPSAK